MRILKKVVQGVWFVIALTAICLLLLKAGSLPVGNSDGMRGAGWFGLSRP
jgi:hypothetical protein